MVAVQLISDILGGLSVGFNVNTPFIDGNGVMRDVSTLIVTEPDGPGYSKIVTKIRTPKVLAVVREQFGCPTMTGMPLEDIPMRGGYSVHWEARVAGPEVRWGAALLPVSYVGNLSFGTIENIMFLLPQCAREALARQARYF